MYSASRRSLWKLLVMTTIAYSTYTSMQHQSLAHAAPVPHPPNDQTYPPLQADEHELAFMSLRSRVAAALQPYDDVTPSFDPGQQPKTSQRNVVTSNNTSEEGLQKPAELSHAPTKVTKNSSTEAKKDDNKRGETMHLSKEEGKDTPAIFYVPHQDDDALAMALGIREHIVAGRPVYVHLYSDGINAPLRDIVNGNLPCPLHKTPHRFNLSLDDVVIGRTHEFRQSLHALGVPSDHIFETGWSDLEPLQNYEGFKAKLRGLIVNYEKRFPGASHKCISGEYDKDAVGRNPTHRACWDVARDLIDEYPGGWPPSKAHWDFRFYRTYTFYRSPEKRVAQFIRSMPEHLPFKRRSLDQYKKWDPKRGELAWGYHSVKTLIDAAYNDPHVYMDMIDNDPTNPDYDAFLRKEILQSSFSPYWAPKRDELLDLKAKHAHQPPKDTSVLVQQKSANKAKSPPTPSIQPSNNAGAEDLLEESERQEMENVLRTYEELQKTQGMTGYTYWDRLNGRP